MLKIYLTSIVISIVICLITDKSVTAKLKREGLKLKEKSSFIEEIRAWLYFFIPLFNILIAIVCLFAYDEIYQKTKEKSCSI